MACRLFNLHKYPLHIDLRGGETLVLPPGETSRALPEELLYDNPHLSGWEAAGWVARLPARFAETQAPGGTHADAAADDAEDAADEAGEDDTEAAEDDTEAGSESPRPKSRRRRSSR